MVLVTGMSMPNREKQVYPLTISVCKSGARDGLQKIEGGDRSGKLAGQEKVSRKRLVV